MAKRTRLEAQDIEAEDDDTRGELVCKFIEKYVIVPDGALIGRPMHLEPFQRKFILAIYDNPFGTATAYLSMARKNGKTALIAAIMLAHLIGPEQAGIVFSLASKMIRLNPELARITSIVPSLKKIIGLTRNTEYHATSAEGKTAYGFSPILAILDEVGQVRGPHSDFVDAIVTSQGAHIRPLLIAISTQAPNDADMFSVWIDDAIASKDKHTVCHVYEAEENCDLLDKEAWKMSNPALSIFRSVSDLTKQAKRADRMPSFEAKFRNLGLNQRVEVFSPFMAKSVWLANAGKFDRDAFYKGKVFGGLDLSGKNDLTACVLITFAGGKWHVWPFFWTPQQGLKERAHESRTDLELWVKKGFLRVVPGASIDYEHIAKDLVEILEGMDIEAMAFDRWRFDLLKKELDEVNLSKLNLVKFGQGFQDMSPALETLETACLNNLLLHAGNPVLNMCANNSRVEMDAAGNRKLSKQKAVGRIDGMVALAEAFGVTVQPPKEKPRRYQVMMM